MRTSASDLHEFYKAPMGALASHMARRRIDPLWPDLAGKNVLGFGYAHPYLAPYQKRANRIIFANPSEQGALAHQTPRGIQSCVVSERRLPFNDSVFDRVLCVHAMEEASDLQTLMRELWRVLVPEGRILIIAAGRSGLWCQRDSLPFGAGRPFSRTQLRRLLVQARFQPMLGSGAVYVPPLKFLAKKRIAMSFERFGETFCPALSGLVLVEARKRLYVEPESGASEAVRRPIFAPGQKPVGPVGSSKAARNRSTPSENALSAQEDGAP